MSEIAFVGRLDVSTVLDPSEQEGGWYDRRYELVVDHAVKGVEVGDRVIMFGSSEESSCGTSLLDESAGRHVVLSSAHSGRFVADSTPPCSALPSVDALLAADLSLPETSPGPLSVVVTGRLGEAELIGFDATGEPVAYGDLLARAGPPALCPGGERLVQVEQTHKVDVPLLTIRDTGTLRVIERIEIDGSPVDTGSIASFLVDGAEVTCRSQDAMDVLLVLSWEHASDGRTLIVHTDSSVPDDVAVSAHDHASRAMYDPRVDAVVAVADGALVRFDIDGAGHSVVAQLADRATEPDHDAMFIAPDPAGGWWIGMGDGDGELATRLLVLVHVSEHGTVERWPVAPLPNSSYPSSVVVDGDSLTTDQYVVALPAHGSSSDGVVVTPTPRTDPTDGLHLSDGRTIRRVAEAGVGRSVELVDQDGTAHILQHLFEARAAVAIPDGPLIDPASIDRSFRTEPIRSPWVTSHLAPTGGPPSTTMELAPTPPAAGPPATTPDPDSVDDAVETTVTSGPVTGSSARTWWLAGAAVVAVAIAVTATTGLRRRLQR